MNYHVTINPTSILNKNAMDESERESFKLCFGSWETKVQLEEFLTIGKGSYQNNLFTFGKHSKPPPVTLSKAKDETLLGANAANLQAIMAPVLHCWTKKYISNHLICNTRGKFTFRCHELNPHKNPLILLRNKFFFRVQVLKSPMCIRVCKRTPEHKGKK